jgi:hypothetical protein
MSDLNWNKLPWRKSSFSSDSANCVEVKNDDGVIYMRDSKLGDKSPLLRFAVSSWWRFIDPIVYMKDPRQVTRWTDGTVVVATSDRSPQQRYTADEWKAFEYGVRAGEFDPDRLSSPVSSSGLEDTGTVESLPVWGLDPEAATGTAEQGCGAVPVAAESSPPDDWFARQLDADCASIDTPADRLAGRGSLLPASTPDDPRSGGQPGPYVAEITWSEDPSLGEPQGSPAGRPVDASTDEVDLSSAVQPGSDTAGTGTPPDPVPAARYGDLIVRQVEPKFIVEQAPDRTLMSLSVIQAADERALFIAGGHTVYVGYDAGGPEIVYQVVGWDAEQRALILERIAPPPAGAVDAALAEAAAPLVSPDGAL